jgi:hypothetical protein
MAIVALGTTVLAGCAGTSNRVRFANTFANKALSCVAIRASGQALLVGSSERNEEKRANEEQRVGRLVGRFVKNPKTHPPTPDESLFVKWPDGEYVGADVYASEAEAAEAVASFPTSRQRYGVVTTSWKQPPTLSQQGLLAGCGL